MEKTAGPRESGWVRFKKSWDVFWYKPRDPTLLALIRIGCGVLTIYTLIAYSFDLDAFFGEHGWMDLAHRLEAVREKPIHRAPLRGLEAPLAPPTNDFQRNYLAEYTQRFKTLPPAPYPQNEDEARLADEFRQTFGFDFRTNGLGFPQNETDKAYLWDFARLNRRAPGPPYPKDAGEAEKIQEYINRYDIDPRMLLTKGSPVWSVFFHITDPTELRLFHAAAILVTVLFTFGFATRLTTCLTWFVNMCYIHRAPHVLFGADTMMNILLLYLMIGSCGAALSIDRLIARWWARNKLAVVNRWRSWWSKPALSPEELRPVHFSPTPEPTVSANFAIRLLQIHVCIIYFVAGISKLLGPSWWAGTAVWSTIANFEFAPMQFELYNQVLRFLGHNDIVFTTFLAAGTYFTLVFEVAYPFLIWRPFFRWMFLAGAVFLHGLIGMFMGLKTFALIMLVMNMAFMYPHEAQWMVSLVTRWFKKKEVNREAVGVA